MKKKKVASFILVVVAVMIMSGLGFAQAPSSWAAFGRSGYSGYRSYGVGVSAGTGYGGYGRYGSYGYGSYGYGGYGYGYGYYPTGLKFKLDLVPEAEREIVRHGVASIGGAEIGPVGRHDSWYNASIRVPPGTHEVTIVLPDGRNFQTRVVVLPGQIQNVYPRFSFPPS